MRRTFLTVGLLATLIGCYSGTRPPRIGQNAPDFTVQDSDHKVTLSEFRGQVVVLNFWGSWCAPCIEETPSLIQMQAKLKKNGVTVLGVSIDADDAAYHKFLKEFGVNFVAVRDEAQKSATLYGTFRWPETYVIDRNGVVRRKFIGAVNWSQPGNHRLPQQTLSLGYPDALNSAPSLACALRTRRFSRASSRR